MSSRPVLLAVVSLVSLVIAAGCGGSTDPSVSQGEGGPSKAASTAAAACCPPDEVRSGSMNLGGAKQTDGSCHKTSDFWCSENWRIEKDDAGCDVWRYDVGSPEPGENGQCQRLPQAGP